MSEKLQQCRQFRERSKARILEVGPLGTRRFVAVDSRAHAAWSLDLVATRLPESRS